MHSSIATDIGNPKFSVAAIWRSCKSIEPTGTPPCETASLLNRYKKMIVREKAECNLGQANRTFELARRDVDQHLVRGPFAKPVFRRRSFPTGKSLLLAVEATKARAFNLHLAAVKANPFL